MRAPGPSPHRTGARPKPEERPQYVQRAISPVVELRLPLPPSANSLFANVRGRGRIKTPRYRAWRQQAVLAIEVTRPRSGRIAGPAEIEIILPPFQGDPDNRIKPCIDAVVEAGILAADTTRFVQAIRVTIDKVATDVRMVLRALTVDADDSAEIETRARIGQSPAYIAVALGLSPGQVEAVLAGAPR